MAEVHTTREEPGTTHTTVIEERRGSGAGWLIGIVLLIAVIVGAWFLYATVGSTNHKNNAIAGAAHSVGHAADTVSSAASGNGG